MLIECIANLSKSKFIDQYEKWCPKSGYHFRNDKAPGIYEKAHIYVDALLPKSNHTKFLIQESIQELNTIIDTIARTRL